jgi:hypothetical protein
MWNEAPAREASGAKALEHKGGRDARATAEFTKWHRTIGREFWATDVDLIEWRSRYGTIMPVATWEVSAISGAPNPPETYKDSVVERYNVRDLQGFAAREVANALGCHSFVLLAMPDLSQAWLYCLTDPRGWMLLKDIHAIEAFIRRL